MPSYVERRTFRVENVRISFRQFFYSLVLTTLVFLNGYLFLVEGIRNPLVYLIPVPISVAAIWAVAIGLMKHRFPIRLEPDRFVCCDWLCRYQPVSWESIQSAEIWPMLGLRYLRIISSESKLPLWFPLNVARRETLSTLFLSYIDEDHPLAIALRRAE